MRTRCLIAVAVLLPAAVAIIVEPTAPLASAQPEPEGKKGPSVNSRLKVRLPDGPAVSLKAGTFPIELKFTNFEPKEKQTLSVTDFTFALLDKNGEQVNGGLVNDREPGEKIVLRGASTTFRPRLELDPVVKVGAEYYFVCIIGNQSGLVKFTVKE